MNTRWFLDLFRQKYLSLDEMRSTNVRRCPHCGVAITNKNDSGWEMFLPDGKHTQVACQACMDVLSGPAELPKSREA
jgi:hypothetical protein